MILKNKIITTAPTLTTTSLKASDEDGLYKSTDTNTGEPTYYFRGATTNNYVSFASFTWRVVRINEDGTIRMIMQDGINNNASYSFNSKNGNYVYMYYSNSDIKTPLENWYQTNIGNKSDLASKVATGSYYCEQAKVKYSASYASGSASMDIYTSYTPNFKCSTDGNGKGILNSSVGLITYDEIIHAGGYVNILDNSYLYNNYYNNHNFWTMSPGGVINGPYEVWVWRKDHGLFGTYQGSSSDLTLRPVINVKKDTAVTGTGTVSDPYIIR